MVELITSQLGPSVRAAGQVSNAPAQALGRLANAAQGTANNFSQYYEEKAATERELTLARAQSDWSRTYAERAKNAGSGFTESIMADYDAYVSEAMANYGAGQPGNIGMRGREQLQAGFERYRINIEEKAMQREAAARAAAASRARAETDRLRANALLSDPTLLDEYLEGANPAQRSLYIRSALSAQLMDDPEAVQDQVVGGRWDADLTPEQKLTFMKQAESGVASMQREMEIERNQIAADLETQANENAAYAMANGAPPADSSVTLESFAAVLPPAEAQEAWAQYQQQIALAEDVHRVSTSTPGEINFVLEELQAAVSEPGHTAADVNRLNTYRSALEMRNKAIEEDAANHVVTSSDAVSSLLQAYGSAEGEARSIAAERYANALSFEYDRLGVPDGLRTFLPDSMAKSVVESFQNMGRDMAPLALRDFRNQWGDAAPAIIEQLSREGLAPEYVEAMRYSDDPVLSAAIASLAGVTDTQLREGIPTADTTMMTLELQAEVVEYRKAFEAGGDTSAALTFNRTYGVAERLILSRMRSGEDASTAVQHVTGQMFPETPINTSSARALLPVGVSEANFGRVTDEARDSLEGVVPLRHPAMPEFASAAVSQQHLRDRGVWLNNSNGTGVVLHYNIGGYFLPAEVEGGGFYEVPFSAMQGGGSGAAGFALGNALTAPLRMIGF